VRWLVDGMNVIGSRPDGWWHDRRGAMVALVHALGELGEPATVVFDGRPFDAPYVPGVEVLFAERGGRNAADDRIAALVESDTEPAELLVVTSDRDLAARVEAAGAGVEGAGSFRRRLDPT
jgi:hypothetical protein